MPLARPRRRAISPWLAPWACLWLVCPATAQAFERDGLVGGMTVKASLAVLSEAGLVARTLPTDAAPNLVLFHKKGRPGESGSLMFCEGRLALYAPPQPQGPSDTVAFLNALRELTARWGPGTYRLSGPASTEGWIQYRWTTAHEITNLQLSVIGSSSYTSLGYIEPGSCMDRPDPPAVPGQPVAPR